LNYTEEDEKITEWMERKEGKRGKKPKPLKAAKWKGRKRTNEAGRITQRFFLLHSPRASPVN